MILASKTILLLLAYAYYILIYNLLLLAYYIRPYDTVGGQRVHELGGNACRGDVI